MNEQNQHEPTNGIIYIKRVNLSNLASFANVYFHELAHAISRAPDNSRAITLHVVFHLEKS